MDFCCYILYSSSTNHYYVGYTSDINERIKQHNESFFGRTAYTAKANDWELFLHIPCISIEQAIAMELKIKKMKSRKYIENLKKFPDLVSTLLNETNR